MSSYAFSVDSSVDDRAYRIVTEDRSVRQAITGESSSSGDAIVAPGAHPSTVDISLGDSFKNENTKSEDMNSFSTDDAMIPGAHSERQRSNDESKLSSSKLIRGSDKEGTSGSRAYTYDSSSKSTVQTQATSSDLQIQAKLVQDDDGISSSERNLNIVLQQENERLRQQLEIPTATVQPVSKEESHQPSNGRCSKTTILLVIAGLILIGAGVGAFFATQSATEPSQAEISSPAAPTDALLLYDPPSAADCLAIQTLEPVQGQDDMSVKTFEVELELSLSIDTVLETLMEDVILSAQEAIVPPLVGCYTRRKLMMRKIKRKLNKSRYAIANAQVSGRTLSDVCEGTTPICYMIALEFDLYLKSSDIRDFVVIALLNDAFFGDLVDRLGFGGSVFETIAVTSIGRKLDDVDNDTLPNIPSSSCTGAEETCLLASGPIGSGSCTGAYRTCYGSQATIGIDSCNNGGCTGLLGVVENNACNGANACPAGRAVEIARGSCNCDGCCSCLTEPLAKFNAVFVPPQSCNSLAPNEAAIDYSLDRLTPGDGATTYCCSST